ncbi:hypothetical protein N658DRAFT_101612 [Parathielavia hyrcaniae]|uniref:Uncharacterized protein n=1 Tax=Parathielavia hyrcaniae TaxID=113614 RepID=A0AAN6T199_9PEZI|nr:hypothetical protein N658DRAFT_101612 [Parathielavia hyrcaniae]
MRRQPATARSSSPGACLPAGALASPVYPSKRPEFGYRGNAGCAVPSMSAAATYVRQEKLNWSKLRHRAKNTGRPEGRGMKVANYLVKVDFSVRTSFFRPPGPKRAATTASAAGRAANPQNRD